MQTVAVIKRSKQERDSNIAQLQWVVAALLPRYGKVRPDMVDDLESTGLVALVEAVDSWRAGPQSMATFVYSRVRAAMKDLLEQEQRAMRGAVSLDEEAPTSSDSFRSRAETLGLEASQEKGVIECENLEQLSEAMNCLSDEERALVTMRFYEDADFETIAQTMRVAVSTIHYRLDKAFEKLRKRMSK